LLSHRKNMPKKTSKHKQTAAAGGGSTSSILRGDSTAANDASLRGVTLDFLVEFTYEHNLWEMSTYEVVRRIVAPATRDAGGQAFTCVLPPETVGRPSVFLSHAWRNPFGLVVAAARKFVSNSAKRGRHTGGHHPPVFLWLDVFAVSQHPGDHQKDDLTRLEATIARADCTTLVVLDEAGIPLTRCWCVYEFFVTLLHAEGRHGKLQVRAGSLVPGGAGEFVPCSDPERLAALSSSVDVMNTEAAVPADKRMILARLSQLGLAGRRDGAHELHRKLARAVRKGWR
jgi:hypothetical protein